MGKLADDFAISVWNGTEDSISSIAEVAFDSSLDDGLLKEIPIFSTLVAVYKVSSKVKYQSEVRKLASFMCEVSSKMGDDKQRQKYKRRFEEQEGRERLIEQMLIIIQHFTEESKTKLLASSFLAFLDNKIDMEQLTEFSITIDSLFSQDLPLLSQIDANNAHISDIKKISAAARLESLGLIERQNERPHMEGSTLRFSADEDYYIITDLGKLFISVCL